ncbi:MAG: hypothetical protein ABFD98_13610 [Syntrophobacteraceae bacterium]
MSVWSMMNYVAWALCFIFALLLALDFVRVEREQQNRNQDKTGKGAV